MNESPSLMKSSVSQKTMNEVSVTDHTFKILSFLTAFLDKAYEKQFATYFGCQSCITGSWI